MSNARILVVEDDAIIGRHIQSSLKRLGYEVAAVLQTGEEAVQHVWGLNPDLILMDISLAGEIDGIEAAAQIRTRLKKPLIFLTAFADDQTLQRARVTDPFGYLLKPFDERILQITIEMSLYKHALERRLVESEELLRTLVENQGEGVAIVNPVGVIIFTNPALESIFNEPHGSLVGRNISEFAPAESFRNIQLQVGNSQKGERSLFEAQMERKDGTRQTIEVTATPWINKEGEFAGTFALISDISQRKAIEDAERQARTLAEVLRETAAALNSTLEFNQVLDLILETVGRVVPNDGANVMLIEGEDAKIVRHRSGEMLGKMIIPASHHIKWKEISMLSEAAETGQPIIIPNMTEQVSTGLNPRMNWLRSYIGAPLRSKNELIGFLNLGSLTPDFFSQTQVNRLSAFANQAALAIENARLFVETRKRAEFEALLNEITMVSISAADEQQTMSAVAEKMTRLFKADGVFLTSWDEEQQLTIPSVGYGYTSESYASIPYKPGELTLTASVLRSGRAMALDDIRHSAMIDPELADTFPLASMMGLPLIADGIRLGAVIVGFKEFHEFTKEEIEMGERVSSQVALVVSKARLYTQVQRMSITDELTGLFNRRGIFEKGREALSRSQRTASPLGLIWMDIDRFKEVNDTYGHHIGDQVVRGVSELCRASVRDHDLIGRYGGEGGDELIVLLPDTDLAAARQVAERLRQRIADEAVLTERGAISVTVSLGVSIMTEGTGDLNLLLSQADQAMYAAKSAGRNCVVIAEEA